MCEGDSILISSQGGVSYQWEGANGFACNCETAEILATDSDLQTGFYTVTITDNQGCEHVESHYITVNDCSPIAEDDSFLNPLDSYLIETTKCFPITQNDNDPNGEQLSICQIDGQTVSGGSTITLSEYPNVNIEVTLNSDSICVTNNGYSGHILKLDYHTCDPNNNIDSGYIDLVFAAPPAMLTRFSELDDSTPSEVTMSAANSLDCDGNVIADLSTSDYKVRHPIYYSDGIQDHDVPNITEATNKNNNLDNVNDAAVSITGNSYLLVVVEITGGVLSYDWSNSVFGLPVADQLNIESTISLSNAVTAEITYLKRDADSYLKGSSYADNCDYSPTNSTTRDLTIAGTVTTTGTNYFNTIVGLQEDFDVDGSPEMEGGFLILDNATVEDITGNICGFIASSNEETQNYIAKKGIKRIKHSGTNYSSGNSIGTLPDNQYTMSINRTGSRAGFTTMCGVISAYTVNAGNNTSNSSEYGSEWWRLDKDNTTLETWGLVTSPYDVFPVALYGGDNPNMPTNVDVAPTGSSFAYSEINSQRLNGLDANLSSIYEQERVQGDAAATRVANPFASWTVSPAFSDTKAQYISYQFVYATSSVGHVYNNEGDTYKLKLVDGQIESTTELGTIQTSWNWLSSGQVQRVDSDGDITAFTGQVFRTQPEFMTINTFWTVEAHGEVKDDTNVDDLSAFDIFNKVQIEIVETF